MIKVTGLFAFEFFLLFLFCFAVNAEGGDRPGQQSFFGNGAAANFANAEGSLLDLDQSLVDFGEEGALATAKAKLKGLQILTRCEIHLVGQIR